MQIYKYKDYDAASNAAANLVIQEIIKKPNMILGLATGVSPIGLYQNLVKAYENDIISFKKIKTFNLDEYVGINNDHPQSYHYFMNHYLFDYVDILPENINIPATDKKNIEELAEEYNIKLFGNQRDLQILGIGKNGHIGFNEPGSQLGGQTYKVKLDEQTRKDNSRYFNSIDEVPKYAITMGIKNIMYSKKILLIALGESKAEAVYKMVHGIVSDDFPASILQLHPDITIIVDEAAASKLNMKSDHLVF
ncbi:MAG: glucosamine-6-phosphate deaminase [Tenericutes bacterium]|jgi:glucosamine-6-phosphate deaminase|nr:glucosamine-6-phosphate deaminase [Mycoplasmatota bacterium]